MFKINATFNVTWNFKPSREEEKNNKNYKQMCIYWKSPTNRIVINTSNLSNNTHCRIQSKSIFPSKYIFLNLVLYNFSEQIMQNKSRFWSHHVVYPIDIHHHTRCKPKKTFYFCGNSCLTHVTHRLSKVKMMTIFHTFSE